MSMTPDGREGGKDLPFEVVAVRQVLVEAGVAGA